jgi:general L-amino acid transport system permease protein
MSNGPSHAVAFVARQQIPPSPPPLTERGVIRWLHENLFSSWLNAILTIASIVFVAWALWRLLPWLAFDAVWNAGSLSECRSIGTGACWAVVNERLNQWIYGFYPADLYWRPNLAFALLFPALWPMLFDNAPYRRQLLVFTALYPVIAFWLIWGGSVWGVLATVAGPVVGYFTGFRVGTTLYGRHNFVAGTVVAALATVMWWLFAVVPLSGALTESVGFVGLQSVASERLGGFLLTMIIGLVGISASLPLGILLALGRKSDLPFIKVMCVIFIEFIRGVPLITLLFVANVVLAYFLPPGTEFDKLLRVLIMVTMFSSAYLAEVVRGGLAALPQGQYEAANALGLDYWKSTRLIVLPQALKISIPGIVNTFIGLFKDTTLVSVIALLDPLGIISPIRSHPSWNGLVWEPYLFVAAFFFVCCFGMSRYSMYLERKLETERR